MERHQSFKNQCFQLEERRRRSKVVPVSEPDGIAESGAKLAGFHLMNFHFPSTRESRA